ncbi:VacJ family lipoprotein [Roseibacterium sp. SDUM158017]|uniref:MlaA family lipoprotein n=1 Tax=Roseicyclus salinarum TaxID=3036773 RepID=UPI0024158F29|nr:VacJ family lipoprotein [Roseibacterium sp. SDUM158017]MDG4648959.1 VacJ family lipoprotein [Roseibacterium sp. SDUM158017]
MPFAHLLPRPAARRRTRAAGCVAALLCLVLSACGPAPLPPGDRIADASEEQNRATHRFNVALDRGIVDPAAEFYGAAVPRPVRRGIGNFASNLNQPGYVLNNLLQARIDDAARNTLRFAINSTIGLAGLLDPATALGLPAEETDFGETMHIYGLGEGDYHVLPVFGPSTTRDSVGLVVDLVMNPLRHVAEPPQSTYLLGTRALAGFGNRYTYDDTIDDVLYNSADSYAQLRSLYLQNRRFELGGGAASTRPLSGAGDAAGQDPYVDPYLDPYGQ